MNSVNYSQLRLVRVLTMSLQQTDGVEVSHRVADNCKQVNTAACDWGYRCQLSLPRL